jgi:GGDEF domain-containing protein
MDELSCQHPTWINPPLENARPFASFGESLPALLAILKDMVPLQRWSAARRDEASWKLLEIGAPEKPERAQPAPQDLVCLRLAESLRLRYIANAATESDRIEARVLARAGIAACIVCPLISRRGELLGALYAIDAQPQPPFSVPQRRLVAGLARTLATLFAYSLRHDEPHEARIAGYDPLSGLPNLQAWQSLMEQEEAATLEPDDDALAVMIELEEPENADFAESEILMSHHAALLKSYLRDHDRVGRIGGNRFALLLRHLNSEQAQAALDKIGAALRHADATAVIGCAMRHSCGSLPEAFRIADIRMYNAKLGRP